LSPANYSSANKLAFERSHGDRYKAVALRATTPHPTGFAGHLLPQGEKGRTFLLFCALCEGVIQQASAAPGLLRRFAPRNDGVGKLLAKENLVPPNFSPAKSLSYQWRPIALAKLFQIFSLPFHAISMAYHRKKLEIVARNFVPGFGRPPMKV
jgi:hypothetical protein